MDAPQELKVDINPQDMLEAIASQRDAALNEIVRQASIIRALTRKIEELTKPKETADGSPDHPQ